MDFTKKELEIALNVLTQLLKKEEEEEERPIVNKKKRISKAKQNNKDIVCRTEKMKIGRKRINKFENMPEKNAFKKDIEIDKILNVKSPTPRSKQLRRIKAVCYICGREESVHPTTIGNKDNFDRYKCNRCITRGKR